MKKMLFMGIAATLLTACSSDDVVLQNNEANAIRFSATAERNTRADEVYCPLHMPTSFYVTAVHNNQLYITKDEIVTEDNYLTWTNKTGLRYWPNEGSVSFYGYKNGEITWLTKEDKTMVPTFADFTVNNVVAQQKDLVYAVKTQQKNENNNKVNLNFRHALSQIVFNARNDNQNLYVEIEEVAVVNVDGTGTYTFPTADTENNIPHENPSYINDGRGSWADLDAQGDSYRVACGTVQISGDKSTVDLTTDNSNETDFSKAMLLIPQTTDAVVVDVPEGSEFDKTQGSYFLVKCRIWNVADATKGVNKDSDVILWGKEGASDVLIPVSFNWEEGYRYVYTFVFGNGNGGYNPDPTPEDPDPDPVLVPITFTVSVDEFVPVDAEAIETGVPGTGK